MATTIKPTPTAKTTIIIGSIAAVIFLTAYSLSFSKYSANLPKISSVYRFLHQHSSSDEELRKIFINDEIAVEREVPRSTCLAASANS